jgi:hypothetical protein
LTPQLNATGGGSDTTDSQGSAVVSLTDSVGNVVALADSSAYANAAGVLGITASTSNSLSDGSVAYGVANATLDDVIHFHVLSGLPFSDSILVSMDVHASWSNSGPAAPGLTLAQAHLFVFNPAVSNLGHSLMIGSDSSFVNGGTSTLSATITKGMLQSMITNYPQYVTAEASGYDIAFTLEMSLQTAGALPPGYQLDASHTATLSISTPVGVNWTSASGLLAVSPVPEPATASLMLFGIFALAAARHARRV